MSRLLPRILVVVVLAGCGGSSQNAVAPNATETSPPGDIPDNQAFVAYAPPGGGYSVKVPEGWARTASGGAVTFTDKLNSIRMQSLPASSAPTVESVKADVPKIADVSTVQRQAGSAVLAKYVARARADAVTNRSGQNDVERYVFFHNGRAVVLTLSGPKGADNVDPWRIVTDSLHWSR
jgi:hypothetical protein